MTDPVFDIEVDPASRKIESKGSFLVALLVASVLATSGFVRGGTCDTGSFTAEAGSRGAPRSSVELGGSQVDELEQQRVANRGLFVRGLLDLAQWCSDNELYLERDNLYHRVIEMEPDNLDARKGLRYARNPDGTWKEPAPRAAKNRSDGALALLAAKRSEFMRPYCEALLDFMERVHADAPLRKRVIDEVLSLDPDGPRIHQLFDDVKFEGKWMTPETAAGKKQRADLKALIDASREGVPAATPATNTETPKGPRAQWKCAVETPTVRVLANAPDAECREIARTCTAVGRVMQGLFHCPVEFADKYTVYVFATPEEKDAFVAHLAEFTLEGRALMLSRPNVALDGTDDVLLSDPDPVKRLDCAVRSQWARLLKRAYGVADKQGWIADGLGLYLTREMCGTRSTWFILGTLGKDQAPLRTKLSAPNANWFDEASKVLQGEKSVRLETVVTLNLRSMRIEDMLAAHALAVFLIEGHASELPELLKRIGAGEPTATAVKAVLGCSMDELQTRLTRWLRERR